MKVSFEGIGENVITFYNDMLKPAELGNPVKMSANGEVSACSSADRFFGVCIDSDTDYAAVQTAGYIHVNYSGETAPTVGFVKLAADGNGGVAVNSAGNELVVIDVDTANSIIGIML